MYYVGIDSVKYKRLIPQSLITSEFFRLFLKNKNWLISNQYSQKISNSFSILSAMTHLFKSSIPQRLFLQKKIDISYIT